MDWFLAAVVSAIALSGQALMFQQLQKHYSINVFMTYAWLGAAVVLSVLFLRPADFSAIVRNIVPLLLAGLTSLTGNYAFNRAIRLQSNIGYIESIMAWRLILTYVFSIIVLNASFEVSRLGGVVLIVCGVLAVSGAYRMRGEDIQWDWFNWALLGGLSFGLLTIFARYANDDGVSGEVSLVIVLIVAGIAFLVGALREPQIEKTKFDDTAKSKRVNILRPLTIHRQHIGLILAVIIFATVGNGALFVAFEKTPNLAYAIAIDNSRIIILYLFGLVLFAERWQMAKAVGVVLTFIGILLLS